MVAFLNSLPQDRDTRIEESDNHITDGLGGVTPVYASTTKKIKLIVGPLTESEKDSVLSHYTTNIVNTIDLIVNHYNTGTIQVFYSKAPKVDQVGRVHWKVTCEFRS